MWVPNAFSGAAAGLVVGAGLGLLGLVLTRWEPTAATLHYTPNRWLVLIVTFMVSARVLSRIWQSGRPPKPASTAREMVLAFGIPQSLAVGGEVIGYYIAYAWGVRRRVLEWQRRPVRVMCPGYAPPLTTTRRFWARPSRVVFEAAGLFSP